MSVYKKLAIIQRELVAKKDKWNSFSKYQYRSAEGILESLKPHLKKHELLLTSDNEVVLIGSNYYTKVTLKLFDVGLDKYEEPIKVSALARESDILKGQISAQISGGTQSYALKYALNSMFLIDDGNGDADSQNTQEEMEMQKTETLGGYLKAKNVSAKEFTSHYMINASKAKELLADKPLLENMVAEYLNIKANNQKEIT